MHTAQIGFIIYCPKWAVPQWILDPIWAVDTRPNLGTRFRNFTKIITQPFSYRDLIYPTSACPHAKMLPPPLKPHLRQLMEATTKRLKQTIQMVKISCLFTNEKKNSHQFLAHFCPNLTLFHILSLPNPILFVKN